MNVLIIFQLVYLASIIPESLGIIYVVVYSHE